MKTLAILTTSILLIAGIFQQAASHILPALEPLFRALVGY